ncbi:hypothetical protein KRR26_29230 [Corallococcus sp. M34]|uniref:hypothetical protein n=1 Tax=Citreicoccus inhibens TaxID=2849499 RepID=UPI001C223357|nr:hypothetical protein [Citreicoccus inhibens]MBU8899701.1 hypothetical protein [Citreicoccus inhibens]
MKRLAWARLTALALLALSACECGTGDDPCFIGLPPGVPESSPLTFTGRTTTIFVQASASTECGSEAPPQSPESVEVQVYGPDNLLVPATAKLINPSPDAEISFVPPEPGRYHAIIRFAPVGGVVQRDVLAIAQRQDVEPVSRLSEAGTCNTVDRTAKGTWLCDGLAMRDGAGADQRLGNALRVSVSGDVVWTVDDRQVKRYVDTDTELKLTGTLALVLGPDTMQLASEDELLVFVSTTLSRITFTESQGLVQTSTARWQDPIETPAPGAPSGVLLLRAGHDSLLALGPARIPNPGTLGVLACEFQRNAGDNWSRAVRACQSINGTVVGFEAGAVWLRDVVPDSTGSTLALRRWEVREGQLVEVGSLSLPFSLSTTPPLMKNGPVAPIINYMSSSGVAQVAVARWDATRTELSLESLPELRADSAHANERWVWGLDLAGTTHAWVYSRDMLP